jgi:hypothetical protein
MNGKDLLHNLDIISLCTVPRFGRVCLALVCSLTVAGGRFKRGMVIWALADEGLL